MFATLGGWAFLTSSYKILSGAQTLTKGISSLIQKTELSKKDRLNLRSLERRLECITQPLNYCLIAHSGASEERPMNSLEARPIEQSASLIEEIIGFITRVNSTANFVFDDDFSVELEHYCAELEFLVQSLQLSIDINRQFQAQAQTKKDGVEEDHSQFSMSAFLRASHRIRSMSLVSGYILTQKGCLLAKITHKKGSEASQASKWTTIMDSGEINVVFHPKYRRYQLDIVSSEEHTAFIPSKKEKPKQKIQADAIGQQRKDAMNQEYFGTQSKADIETRLRQKKRFQFVLSYGMYVRTVRNHDQVLDLEQTIDQYQVKNQPTASHPASDHQQEEIKGLEDTLNTTRIASTLQTIQMDSQSIQLIDIIQKYNRGEWLIWSGTAEDFQLVDDVKYEERQVVEFAFKIDKSNILAQLASSSAEDGLMGEGVSDSFSIIDIIYLLRLCCYENEQAFRFGAGLKTGTAQASNGGRGISNFVTQQADFNRSQRKPDKDHSRGLQEEEIGKPFTKEALQEINADAEVNEHVHGLSHLQASDEELRRLLSKIT